MSGRISTGSQRLNIRKGPGTNFGIVSTVPTGATVDALGRNEKAGWILIEIPGQDGEVGWVSARYVNLDGDPADLPVSEQQSEARVIAAASSGGSSSRLSGKLVFQEVAAAPSMFTNSPVAKVGNLRTAWIPPQPRWQNSGFYQR